MHQSIRSPFLEDGTIQTFALFAATVEGVGIPAGRTALAAASSFCSARWGSDKRDCLEDITPSHRAAVDRVSGRLGGGADRKGVLPDITFRVTGRLGDGVASKGVLSDITAVPFLFVINRYVKENGD